MRVLKTYLKLFIITSIFSCSSGGNDDEVLQQDPINVKSSSAKLFSFNIEYNGSIFNCAINGDLVEMDRPMPFDANEGIIKSMLISSGATSNKIIGDKLQISSNSQEIVITAEDGLTKKTYNLTFKVNDYTSIVEKHGLLQVNGNKIVDKDNEAISLAGNSFFWTNNNWGGLKYYKASVVSWLKLDWNTTIVRAAMGVEDSGGYLDDKLANKNRLKIIVDAAIDQGIYVIIDWHSHHAEDNTEEAVNFFKEMASLYGEYPNVIYEIYNEPLDVSWNNVIKPYAETVISAIRAIDPDNIIIVGTPEWSQKVDEAANNPITSSDNIAYTLHFYSVHHKQWLRDRAKIALDKGIALFITEWGTIGYTQNDPETDSWMKWCKENSLSHCSWAVNDKAEEWSIVKEGANSNGSWNDNKLTESGKLTRSINRKWHN